MGKNSKDKKTTKAKSGKGTGDKSQDFLKGDRVVAPKRTEVETETESSEDDTGGSWDTVCDKRSLRQERRARKAGRHIDSQESQAKDDSSADEDNNNTGKASAALSQRADKKEKSYEREFPTLVSSDAETLGDEGKSKASPLAKLMKADKKLFKAVSVIAAETAENEIVAAQLDHIIDEISKMKSLILEATHEVAGLRGELRAVRETMGSGQGPTKTMADVIRSSAQGEIIGQLGSPKQREAIVVRSSTHGAEELSKLIARNIDPCSLGLRDVEMRPVRSGVVISSTSKEAIASLQKELQSNEATGKAIEVTQARKRLPQIKVVGISEELSDVEIKACLITQNDLRCTSDDFVLTKSWKGRGGITKCFDITGRASEALKGRSHLNIKWTRCRFFDNTFIPRCKNCAQAGHVEKFCRGAAKVH
ncbi:hypothetical protein MRX96_058781 [Rhipicephalus microplus]